MKRPRLPGAPWISDWLSDLKSNSVSVRKMFTSDKNSRRINKSMRTIFIGKLLRREHSISGVGNCFGCGSKSDKICHLKRRFKSVGIFYFKTLKINSDFWYVLAVPLATFVTEHVLVSVSCFPFIFLYLFFALFSLIAFLVFLECKLELVDAIQKIPNYFA